MSPSGRTVHFPHYSSVEDLLFLTEDRSPLVYSFRACSINRTYLPCCLSFCWSQEDGLR